MIGVSRHTEIRGTVINLNLYPLNNIMNARWILNYSGLIFYSFFPNLIGISQVRVEGLIRKEQKEE